MSETQVESGAGPALAAHSKDASAQGQTPASQAAAPQPGPSHFGSAELASARQAATTAWDQMTDVVRAQPMIAVAVTGIVGLLLGVLISRR